MTSGARKGFTLLEMILALTIGVVLLGALYQFLNGQLFLAQAGRDVLEEGTLARAILTRMTNDILGHLGENSGSLLPASSSGSTGANSSGGSNSASGSSSSNMSSSSGASSTSTTSSIQVNLGVRGESNRIILSLSRLPRELLIKANNQDQQTTADLRRVTYWLLDNGGLARQEIRAVTGEDADVLPPDVDSPEKYLMAPEVTFLDISYFDGSAWQSSWDGTLTGGVTGDIPLGPPNAIAITIRIRRARSLANDNPTEAEYRHVVAIPAGNGFGQGQ
ncbi:MAG: prepilin-type N-terminal cleavage/methylation domain-containing protein [Planctomycetes bacterium]|nr:prepilin-type N-terminal cleavage/methylation domain-containing protein [Planctomycetota bacterium]